MTAAFDAFVARFHDHFTQDPNACIGLGIEARQGELPDPSLDATRVQVARARRLLDRLDGIDRSPLDFDQCLDLEMARLWLERSIFNDTLTFNGRTTSEQRPTAAADIGNGIFLMFINDPRPASARLEHITERLEKVPVYLDKLIARLETPVTHWKAVELDKLQGLPALLEVLEGWARESGWADLERFRAARRKAEAALLTYADRLGAMPTTDQFHIGLDGATRIVELSGIDLGLDELHDIARKFLARTSDEIEKLRKRLLDKYDLDRATSTQALQAFLNEKYRIDIGDGPLERVLDAYQDANREILDFVRTRELFPIFENQDLIILRTPAFMAPSIPAGAMMGPPPFREGVRRSLIYLTLSPELLDEHTALSIPVMMIHEGIPGHHLQLATAAGHDSVVRRHLWSPAQSEGWTTMLEDYMLDLGIMGDLTDEVRFIGKRDLARIGARVAIDLYFMSGQKRFLDVDVACDLSSSDPFECAGKLLKAVTGFSDGRVRAELHFYSSERGYPLSYLAGNHLVWKLKQEIQTAQRGRLEGLPLDREFHRVYLQSGKMPLAFLRRVFQHEGLLPGAEPA